MPGLTWEERFRPNSIKTKIQWIPEEVSEQEQERRAGLIKGCIEEVGNRTRTKLPKRTVVWRLGF